MSRLEQPLIDLLAAVVGMRTNSGKYRSIVDPTAIVHSSIPCRGVAVIVVAERIACAGRCLSLMQDADCL